MTFPISMPAGDVGPFDPVHTKGLYDFALGEDVGRLGDAGPDVPDFIHIAGARCVHTPQARALAAQVCEGRLPAENRLVISACHPEEGLMAVGWRENELHVLHLTDEN